MPITRQVVRERSAGYTPSGKQIYKEKTQVSAPEIETSWALTQFIYYLTGIIETLLAFRFLFKLLGANPNSPFVIFVYSLSSLFELPFRGIFSPALTEGAETTAVLEPSTLTAMLVYAILAAGIVGLIHILTNTSED